MSRYYRQVALALILAWAALDARARTSAAPVPKEPEPNKSYVNARDFRLPIVIDDWDRAGLREIWLYGKSGTGDWARQQKVPANGTFFSCTVPGDGEYCYSVVCVDPAGKEIPPITSRTAPDMVIVVDTQVPEVDVSPLSASDKRSLRVTIQDANPDYSSVRLEYQAADKTWKALQPISNSAGVFRLPEAPPGLVRVSAADKAVNKVRREFNFAATPLPATRMPPAMAEPVRTQTQVNKTAAPADKVTPPAEGHRSELAGVPRQLINNTHASMTYQVVRMGPSGVGKIEVWITSDRAHTWQRLYEDQDRQQPVKFDLPGEGIFGIKMIVSNGSGFGVPSPISGDAPDLWVEVDTKKPEVQFQEIKPVSSCSTPTILMSWSASDPNLASEPVDLLYATAREGPWLTIAKGLNREGSYRWSVPRGEVSQFFVRLVASDLAGNKGQCDTPEPLSLDLTVPKTRILKIDPIATRMPALPETLPLHRGQEAEHK